jgi:flagellar hook-associated protein 2
MSSLPAVAGSLTSTPALTFNGLVSGLDTDSIIKGMLAINQRQISSIDTRATQVKQVQAIYKQIQARLLALQGNAALLGRSQNGVFDGRTVTSSKPELVSAAASSSAVAGVYSVQVNSLARAHQIAAQGFDSLSSKITQGTLQLQAGGASAVTITIDSTNDTLQGLAEAINASGAGVSAALVHDGSSNQPYRLLLTSTRTGASNGIQLTNNLAASSGAATRPVFDATYIGPVNLGSGYNGSATPTVDGGAGAYTGSANNVYIFTVLTSGTVGTDNNLQIEYRDSDGSNQGVITLDAGDAGVSKVVAQGLTLQLSAGTLVAGQTFSVKAFVPTVQNAADASVSLGSGSGALTVTSATNQVNNLLTGVTLQLAGTSAGQPVTLQVAADTAKMQQAIEGFVADYNALTDYIQSQSRYDEQTGQAGPLLSDTRAAALIEQVRAVFRNVVPGANPSMNNLSQLGITTDLNGQLQLDTSRLAQILSGGTPGVTISDVRRLFAFTGVSSNPGITFLTGSDRTRASTTPYTVHISQAATQASTTATNTLAGAISIDGTNNTLALTLDGKAVSVTLASGSYSQAALAQLVQTAINSAADLNGRQVSVGLQAGLLTFTSGSFGSVSKIVIGSGSANAALGLAGTEQATGLDVAGHFVVNGATETATGTGQLLLASSANANTSGLQLRVTLTPAQVGAGSDTSLTLTRGFASDLGVLLGNVADPLTGSLKLIDDGFNDQIADLEADKARQTTFMNSQRDRLLQQFANLERTLAQLQSASSVLNSLYSTLLSSSSSSTRNST